VEKGGVLYLRIGKGWVREVEFTRNILDWIGDFPGHITFFLMDPRIFFFNLPLWGPYSPFFFPDWKVGLTLWNLEWE